MNKLKKLIAIGITATTILWSLGIAALPAQATTIADGDLVKTAASSAVYYIQGSYKRVFPHYNVYLSWGYPSDFSTVKTVSSSELAAYTDANAMPFRDGSLFRGTAASLGGKDATAVFYVENSVLRPVLSEQVYQGLFNDVDWVKVTWVPDDLLTKFNYDMGSNLTSSATHPNGAIVQYTGATQKYLIENGQKRAISAAAFSANRYLATSVITIDADEVYADGSAVTGVESGLLTPGWSGIAVVAAITASLYNNFSAALMLGHSTNNGLLQVKLTAGSSAVSVDALTFTRSGIGDTDDWTNLYLDIDSSRATNGRTLNADGQTVEFSGLALNTPANSSKVVALKGDLDALTTADVPGTANQGNRHIFSLTSVDTSSTVTGLPLNGNSMEVGSQDVSTVIISMGTNPSDPSVSTQGAEIANFKVTAGANNISVNQMVVTFGGSLSTSDVTNLKLYDQDGNLLATVASIGSKDRATFTFNSPFAIADSNSSRFSIKADITGKVGQYLYAMIEEDGHLNATDLVYNCSTAVDNTDVDTTTEQNVAGRRIDLQGGEVTLTANGPNAGKIGKNGNDITIFKFSITPTSAVTVKDINLKLKVADANLVASDLLDLKIKDADTGSTLTSKSSLGSVTIAGGYVEFGNATSYDDVDTNTFTLSDDFSIRANTARNFIVTIDTANTTTVTSAKITASIEMAAGYMKDDGTNEYIDIDDIVPESVSGKEQEVIASTLAVSKASLPTSDTFVIGASDVSALGMILEAGEASNVTITKIVGYIHADKSSSSFAGTAYDVKKAVDSISLYGPSGSLIKTVGLQSYSSSKNEVVFDALLINVPAGESQTYTFKLNVADIADSYFEGDPVGGTANSETYLYLEVDPSATSDSIVIAYDSDSRDIDASGSANKDKATVLTISKQGGLTAVQDSSTPDSTIVVMGSTSQEVTKVKFTARDEAYTISKLTIVNLDAAGVATGDIAATTEIASLDLYWDGGEKTGVQLSAGEAKVSGLNIVVPQDGNNVLSIRANINTWSGQAVSGNSIRLGIREDGSSTYFEAVASASGETIYEAITGANILAGENMYVRRTKPIVLANEYTGSLDNKQMNLITFTITADSHEDVALKRISFDYSIFDATSSGNSIKNIDLYRGATKIVEGTDIGTISNLSNTTSTADVLSISWLTTKEEVIPAGEIRTYTLKGTGEGFAENDSFSIRIAEETNTNAAELTDYNDLTADTYFIWSDYYAGVNHSATNDLSANYDWCAGNYVDTLPSNWSSWNK